MADVPLLQRAGARQRRREAERFGPPRDALHPEIARNLLWDDVVLTVLILLGAVCDLVLGSFALFATDWALEHINGIDSSVVEDGDFQRITRSRGVGSLEGGLGALLVGGYRIARWRKRQKFEASFFSSPSCSPP